MPGLETSRLRIERRDLGLVPHEFTQGDDLKSLDTTRAQRFAVALRAAFDDAGFDKLNRLMRADYAGAPLPQYSAGRLGRDIDKACPADLTRAEAALLRAMLLGEAVDRTALAESLGHSGAALLCEGVELGLFKELDGDTISLNNLLLCSHRIAGDKVLYCLADTPRFHPAFGLQHERVYIGPDSYLLNAKLQTMSGVSGTVVEFGSGSGIQLFTVGTLNPGVTRLVGIEIDERARNVSRFNAALNGFQDRFEARAAISGLQAKEATLALSNPPFMPMPATVAIPGMASINLMDEFCRAGWGGEDGLHHTRRFLRDIAPYLAKDGEIVIYSQFTGTGDEPKQILDLAAEFGAVSAKFEPLPTQDYYTTLNFTAETWAATIPKTVKAAHFLLSERAAYCIERAILTAFKERGITNLYSGIVTLNAEEASKIQYSSLSEAESKLETWNLRLDGAEPLLTGLRNMIGAKNLTRPPEIGGRTYAPPGVSPSISHLEDVLLRRKLQGGQELEAGTAHDGRFFYRVKDSTGAHVLEEGAAQDTRGVLSEGYRRALACIELIPAHKLVREWHISFTGAPSAAALERALGTHAPKYSIVTLVDATNALRCEYPPPRGDEHERYVTYWNGSLTCSEALPILAMLRKECADFKIWG